MFIGFCFLGVCLMSTSENGVTIQNGTETSLVVEIQEKQDNDLILHGLKGAFHNQSFEVLFKERYGVLPYKGRLCVPDVGDLIQNNLAEAHDSWYSIHHGATKMYRDL